MPLAADLWGVWSRIGRAWMQYLKAAGLDLAGVDERTLVPRLLQSNDIDFGLPGLEDLARDTLRAIEPGDPARSLLYHVLASPLVTPPEVPEKFYPTIGDLEIVENVIYSQDRPSVADLRLRAGTAPLAIAVFAYEYAPAIDTVHNHHADLCFSRTGISRIGNADPNYVAESRGFMPHRHKRTDVHVIPARFGVFIAMLRGGNRKTIGPEQFQAGDENRGFWVPLHKLFNGPECIDGLDLRLEIAAHHVNEKLARVHAALRREGVDTGWSGADLQLHPFRITGSLASFDERQGLLIPVPHPLVEPARAKDGRYIGFPVPPNHPRQLGTTCLQFPDTLEALQSPEYVHARHALIDGEIVDLGMRRDMDIGVIVGKGGYTAVNFVDYTADGWIEARCPALASEIPKRMPAYSILAQPDFFPLVKQQDLYEWWVNSAPAEIKNNIWPDTDARPSPLSSARLPANLALEGAHFDSKDDTITAIVGLDRVPGPACHIVLRRPRRESTLSFRATNFFDPGWDSAQDFRRDANSPNGTFHLANYGLGSPYLEDTMLCAALGGYWPGAVPDITRSFAPHHYPTVTPILNRDMGWDHVPPPERVDDQTIQYVLPEYIDYVGSALRNQLPYSQFAETPLEEYIARTLAVARVFQALGASNAAARAKFAVLNFCPANDEELRQLEKATGVRLQAGCAFHLEMASVGSASQVDGRLDVHRVKIGPVELFLADTATVARRDGSPDGWQVYKF